VLAPRRQFVKRWTIQNTGTCTWPDELELVFVSGDELEVVEEPEIEPLSSEASAEIEMTLRAPEAYDRYTSVWQLQDRAGNPIGEELGVTFRVGATSTPRATATSGATPTPEFTPTRREPFHFSVPVIVEWRHLPGDTWWAQVGLTAWGGEGNYRYYRENIHEDNEFFNGTFEIEAQVCRAWFGTVIVTSGDEVKEREVWIEYPDADKCD
jgi:hypothetical protein